MEEIKCEICGKEFKSGLNFHGLFGQKACSEECMEALSKRNAKQTADKINSFYNIDERI